MTNRSTIHHRRTTDLPAADKYAIRTVRARIELLSHRGNRFLDKLNAMSCDRRPIGCMLEEVCGEAFGGVVGALDEPRNDLHTREHTTCESAKHSDTPRTAASPTTID